MSYSIEYDSDKKNNNFIFNRYIIIKKCIFANFLKYNVQIGKVERYCNIIG